MTEYSSVAYWTERYSKDPSAFEWFLPFSALQSQLTQLLTAKPHKQQQHTVLVIGCGTSTLSSQLVQQYSSVLHSVYSIDSCQTAIDECKRRLAAATSSAAATGATGAGGAQLQHQSTSSSTTSATASMTPEQSALHHFAVQDVRRLDFASLRFSLVLDKACLDACHCSDAGDTDWTSAVAECHRVLQSGATLLSVSHARPEMRLKRLEAVFGDGQVQCTVVNAPSAAQLQSDTAISSSSSAANANANTNTSALAPSIDAKDTSTQSYYFYMCIKR